MRTRAYGDDARLMHLLLHDGDVAGCLDDLKIVVVAGGQAWQGRADDAAGIQIQVLGAVVWTVGAHAFIPQRGSPLPVRRQRRLVAVGWVINERGSTIGPSAFPPDSVVGVGHVLRGTWGMALVAADGGFFVLRGTLFSGLELAVAILGGTLERRGGGVRPGALQIGLAPGCAPLFRGGFRGRRSL